MESTENRTAWSSGLSAFVIDHGTVVNPPKTLPTDDFTMTNVAPL